MNETSTLTSTSPWTFTVTGMDCADCARTIESGIGRMQGVSSATVNFGTATLSVVPEDDALAPDDVIRGVRSAGYDVAPPASDAAVTHNPLWRSRRVTETAIAAVLWATAFVVEHTVNDRWAIVPYALAMVVAGYPVVRSSWFAIKARRADMNVLMLIASIGAMAIGEWGEGASVLILFAIGITLQNLTLDRTRRAIQALVTLAPASATVLRDGHEHELPLDQIVVDDRVIVRPGGRIAVDGQILTGSSTVNQASITGESMPVSVTLGSNVFAGSINGDGALEIAATAEAKDSTLANIIRLVEEAQASKAPAQAFVDRFAAIYTPIVIALAVLIATAGPYFFGDWHGWLFKALVLLVVACPCALVISTPVALVAAIGSASRMGVLFKGGSAIEALAGIETLALDKTGTITAGKPAVTRVQTFGSIAEDELIRRAASLEQRANHPLTEGIVREAEIRRLPLTPVTELTTDQGRGVQGVVDGRRVLVGSPKLFASLNSDVRTAIDSASAEGVSVVLVGDDIQVEGMILLADELRSTSADMMGNLRHLHVRTVMLTGDHQATGERIAASVGIDDVRAGLLPADKVAAIKSLQVTSSTGMIGDGVNDAPALASADVGIAMGAAGSDAAIEAADVTLMGDNIERVPNAIRLARNTMSIIRQNIAASLLVKVVFLALTFVGVTNLWLAVLADSGMALLVTFNSLRLLRSR